jgi:phage/plasmid-like protein (TIGR03299 family)
MRLGHLGGWNVRTAPLDAQVVDADGVSTVDAPGYATVRTNPFTGRPEALGVVGAGYQPLQNEAHAEFLNTLADVSGATFDTAGSLRGGRQVFITMKLPRQLRIAGTDRVDLNIAALNSHDGSSAFRVVVSPVRVVCANPQAAALGSRVSSVAIRHTCRAGAAVQQAREALGLTFAYAGAFQAEAEKLIQTEMSAGRFDRLVTEVFGPSPAPTVPARAQQNHRRRTERLRWLFDDAATQAAVRGTAWAGVQAVVEYVDHYAPTKTRGDAQHARASRLVTSDQPTRVKHRAWLAAKGW